MVDASPIYFTDLHKIQENNQQQKTFLITTHKNNLSKLFKMQD